MKSERNFKEKAEDAKKQKLEEAPSEEEDEEANNEILKDFHEQQKKYAVKKKTLPAKGFFLVFLPCGRLV